MRKLDELEKKYDGPFRVVFEAIRELMIPNQCGIKLVYVFLSKSKYRSLLIPAVRSRFLMMNTGRQNTWE